MSSPHNPISEQDGNSRQESTESSATHSRHGSGTPRERRRVQFTPGGESLDDQNVRAAFDVQEGVSWVRKQQPKPLPRPRINPIQRGDGSSIPVPQRTDSSAPLDITISSGSSSIPQAGPSIRSLLSSDSGMSDVTNELLNEDEKTRAARSQEEARRRAEELSFLVGSHSAPASRGKSPVRLPPGSPDSPSSSASSSLPLYLNSIPLENLQKRKKYGIEDDTEDDTEDDKEDKTNEQRPQKKANLFRAAADKLVRPHTSKEPRGLFRVQAPPPGLPSGPPTPIEEQHPDDYVPRPNKYREGYLASILRLYNEQGVVSALAGIPSLPTPALGSNRFGGDEEASASAETPAASSVSSGTSTPTRKNKWYYRNASPASTGSMGSIMSLVSSTTMLAQPASAMAALDHSAAIRPLPKHRPRSNNALDTLLGRGQEGSIHVQVHIAETISRQIYLLKLCRALMQYGSPTHRLEGRYDSLSMTKPC